MGQSGDANSSGNGFNWLSAMAVESNIRIRDQVCLQNGQRRGDDEAGNRVGEVEDEREEEDEDEDAEAAAAALAAAAVSAVGLASAAPFGFFINNFKRKIQTEQI